jgi:hypothetical protein
MTILLLQSHDVFSQSRIIKVEDGDLYTIIVKGFASEKLWIGCTVNPDTYSEIDLKPEQVPQGEFTVKFNLSTGAGNSLMQGNTSVPYVVALWKERIRISLRECEKRYARALNNVNGQEKINIRWKVELTDIPEEINNKI